ATRYAGGGRALEREPAETGREAPRAGGDGRQGPVVEEATRRREGHPSETVRPVEPAGGNEREPGLRGSADQRHSEADRRRVGRIRGSHEGPVPGGAGGGSSRQAYGAGPQCRAGGRQSGGEARGSGSSAAQASSGGRASGREAGG